MAPKRARTSTAAPQPNAPSIPNPISENTTTTAATDIVDPPAAPNAHARPKKRKQKDAHILHTSTFRKPLWSYLHLHLTVPGLIALPTDTDSTPSKRKPSTLPPLDPITTSTLLTAALSSFLGLTGSSIPLDILHTDGRTVYIRIPRQDRRAVQGALAAWTGSCEAVLLPGGEMSGVADQWGRAKVAWRVVGVGECLGALGGDGSELFAG